MLHAVARGAVASHAVANNTPGCAVRGTFFTSISFRGRPVERELETGLRGSGGGAQSTNYHNCEQTVRLQEYAFCRSILPPLAASRCGDSFTSADTVTGRLMVSKRSVNATASGGSKTRGSENAA
jgi:hypothetical protein